MKSIVCDAGFGDLLIPEWSSREFVRSTDNLNEGNRSKIKKSRAESEIEFGVVLELQKRAQRGVRVLITTGIPQ